MRRLVHVLTAYCLCLFVCSTAFAAPEKTLTKQQLYQLLLAEFAANRGQQTQALTIFLAQAQALQSPKLAKKATYFAYEQKQPAAMLEAASLWQKLAPNSEQAQLLKALAFNMNQQHLRALQSMTQYFQRFQKSYFVELLPAITSTSPSMQLYQQQLQQLSLNKDATGDILLANALLAQKTSQPKAANNFAWQTIQKAPKDNAIVNASLRILQANNGEQTSKAYSWLLKKQPNNTELRQQFGLYLAKHDLDAATKQFQKLVQLKPEQHSYRYQLALVQLEAQDFESATKNLQPLTQQSTYQDNAYYYLGIIDSLQEKYPQAEKHFAMVSKNNLYADAQIGLARIQLAQQQWQQLSTNMKQAKQEKLSRSQQIDWLLIHTQALLEQQQTAQAITVITDGIEQFNDVLELYYQRAMIYAKNRQFAAMEKDLRHVLHIKPEHIGALNALGFTLADNNTRLNEAHQLVQKAYQLSPEEPAILDSLGWVYYRHGEFKKALPLLQKAMQKLPDPEIAAHLGEVLWQMKKKRKANNVWRESLKQNPKHKILNDTIKRLNAKLLQSCQPDTAKHSCQ